MMRAVVLGLLAETFIHPGAGQADATVDLPVARERTTDYPFIPGSGCKGALRDTALARLGLYAVDAKDLPDAVKGPFGVQDNAGTVIVSDARLLLLPVRSLTGAYKWLTCPHLIERFQRDRERAGTPATPSVDTQALAESLAAQADPSPPALAAGAGRLFLEERTFAIVAAPDPGLIALLAPAIPDERARQRLAGQLAVVSDDAFAWFARYGLAVQARNSLQDKGKPGDGGPNRKISSALWYEETLPPDTVLYLILGERKPGEAAKAYGLLFDAVPYLQLGGNETVGQGQFRVGRLPAKEG